MFLPSFLLCSQNRHEKYNLDVACDLQALDGILCGFYFDLYLKMQLKGKLTPIRFDAYLQLLFHPLILLGFGDTFFLAA